MGADLFVTVDIRKELEETVKSNGGDYRGDLTKEVTHLIACKPAGDKYNYARQWGLRVVSIEWLQQSLERGMILDESLFDPLLSPTERGRNAWIRRTISTSSIAKRPSDNEIESIPARKLRRTASAKLSDQSSCIWNDIVGGGLSAGEPKQGVWDDQDGTALEHATADRRESNPTYAKGNLAQLEIKSRPKPLSPLKGADAKGKGLFAGKQFRLHGFNAKKVSLVLSMSTAISFDQRTHRR